MMVPDYENVPLFVCPKITLSAGLQASVPFIPLASEVGDTYSTE